MTAKRVDAQQDPDTLVVPVASPTGETKVTLAVEYTAEDGKTYKPDQDGSFGRDEADYLIRTGRARLVTTKEG